MYSKLELLDDYLTMGCFAIAMLSGSIVIAAGAVRLVLWMFGVM